VSVGLIYFRGRHGSVDSFPPRRGATWPQTARARFPPAGIFRKRPDLLALIGLLRRREFAKRPATPTGRLYHPAGIHVSVLRAVGCGRCAATRCCSRARLAARAPGPGLSRSSRRSSRRRSGHTSDEPFRTRPTLSTASRQTPLTKWVLDDRTISTYETRYQRAAPAEGDEKTWFFAGSDGEPRARTSWLRLLEGGPAHHSGGVRRHRARDDDRADHRGMIRRLPRRVFFFIDAAFLAFHRFSMMAFPLMLLVIALGTQTDNHLDKITLVYPAAGRVRADRLDRIGSRVLPARVNHYAVAGYASGSSSPAVMLGAKNSRIIPRTSSRTSSDRAVLHHAADPPSRALGPTSRSSASASPAPARSGAPALDDVGHVLSPTAIRRAARDGLADLLPSLIISSPSSPSTNSARACAGFDVEARG